MDLLPAPSDIKVYRGDYYEWIDEFADDATTPPSPIDLSDRTWLCQIRTDKDRGALVATIDVDTTDAATGRIVRRLTSEESSKLVTRSGTALYYWDLQSIEVSGRKKTWLAGKVKVTGDVSDEGVV